MIERHNPTVQVEIVKDWRTRLWWPDSGLPESGEVRATRKRVMNEPLWEPELGGEG